MASPSPRGNLLSGCLTTYPGFQQRDQLRQIWSDPTTGEKLLDDLAEEGYDAEKLDSMKELIDARTVMCTTYWPLWPTHWKPVLAVNAPPPPSPRSASLHR